MRGRTIVFLAILALFASALWLSGSALRRTPRTPPAAVPIEGSAAWDPHAAAAYLDERQTWWESWPKAARDHGTVCVSCHTALPYALARPVLGAALHEEAAPPPEDKLTADVVTRVLAWRNVKPFYGDATPVGRTKAFQSRGTEAVLNALILASRDRDVHAASPEARQAFANMFALQDTSGDEAGAWPWLNFGLRPWESASAVYFGAALAAVAVGMEPQHYAATREIQPNLQRLRTYLRGHLDQSLWSRLLRRDDPRLFNRAMLLWASAELPALISRDEQREIVAALWEAQDPDGSWRLTSLGYWHPGDGVSAETDGDAVATGLVAFALQQAGSDAREPHVARALAWLARHQDPATGMWRASSLNKVRDPTKGVGKFMSDAATAYAVLALTVGTRSSPPR
jgi:squalene-hopene/tetraprenyl-beta-curcumene cyclase